METTQLSRLLDNPLQPVHIYTTQRDPHLRSGACLKPLGGFKTALDIRTLDSIRHCKDVGVTHPYKHYAAVMLLLLKRLSHLGHNRETLSHGIKSEKNRPHLK